MMPSMHVDCDSRVMNSVMPKGVEHTRLRADDASDHDVMNSVMPKGVEHDLEAIANWQS